MIKQTPVWFFKKHNGEIFGAEEEMAHSLLSGKLQNVNRQSKPNLVGYSTCETLYKKLNEYKATHKFVNKQETMEGAEFVVKMNDAGYAECYNNAYKEEVEIALKYTNIPQPRNFDRKDFQGNVQMDSDINRLLSR